MPKRSAEAVAADRWRTGEDPPRPPRDLTPAAKKVWRRLIGSKPVSWWTEPAQVLLAQLCRTFVTLEIVHHHLDHDPVGKDSTRLSRQIATLSAAAVTLTRQLRLGPLQMVAIAATDRISEPGPPTDPLIGGKAVHGPRWD